MDDLEFIGTASDADGNIHNYTWDFGDGNTYTSTQSGTAIHSYDAPGTYSATFTVFDDDGLQSSDTVTANILEYNNVPEVQIISPVRASQQ